MLPGKLERAKKKKNNNSAVDFGAETLLEQIEFSKKIKETMNKPPQNIQLSNATAH